MTAGPVGMLANAKGQGPSRGPGLLHEGCSAVCSFALVITSR